MAKAKKPAKGTTTKKAKPKKSGGRGGVTKIKPAAAATRPKRGCGLGEPGCDALRINDWPRAKFEVQQAIKAGTMKLCEKHLAKLEET